jgi:hypothetical protein
MKHLLIDLPQNAFLKVHKVENEFRWIDDYFKNNFLDLNQIAFWAG